MFNSSSIYRWCGRNRHNIRFVYLAPAPTWHQGSHVPSLLDQKAKCLAEFFTATLRQFGARFVCRRVVRVEFARQYLLLHRLRDWHMHGTIHKNKSQAQTQNRRGGRHRPKRRYWQRRLRRTER